MKPIYSVPEMQWIANKLVASVMVRVSGRVELITTDDEKFVISPNGCKLSGVYGHDVKYFAIASVDVEYIYPHEDENLSPSEMYIFRTKSGRELHVVFESNSVASTWQKWTIVTKE